jgi:hypothetical protein
MGIQMGCGLSSDPIGLEELLFFPELSLLKCEAEPNSNKLASICYSVRAPKATAKFCI